MEAVPLPLRHGGLHIHITPVLCQFSWKNMEFVCFALCVSFDESKFFYKSAPTVSKKLINLPG